MEDGGIGFVVWVGCSLFSVIGYFILRIIISPIILQKYYLQLIEYNTRTIAPDYKQPSGKDSNSNDALKLYYYDDLESEDHEYDTVFDYNP